MGMHGRVDMIPGRAGAAQYLRFGYSKFSNDKKDETMLRKKMACVRNKPRHVRAWRVLGRVVDGARVRARVCVPRLG